MEIPVLHEPKRGCGFRKAGGLYLVSEGTMEECDLLPIRLTVCPVCGEGMKPARGWTWIDADKLIEPRPHGPTERHDARCPLAHPIGRAGLIWIGESFYPTTSSFMAEAEQMGVSRRIGAVPKDFEPGKTLVLLAHRKATTKACDCTLNKVVATYTKDPERDCEDCAGSGRSAVPAIFTAFLPKAVEYVVKGDETEEELERLVERGLRPVKVEPVEETLDLGNAA